jgi:uncharacterized membrane protein YvbJ
MPMCWNCGTEVTEQATVCPHCGKTFALTSPDVPRSAQPANQPAPAKYQPYPGDAYPYSPEGRLERKVDSLRRTVLWILVLQVIFLILIFA